MYIDVCYTRGAPVYIDVCYSHNYVVMYTLQHTPLYTSVCTVMYISEQCCTLLYTDVPICIPIRGVTIHQTIDASR